MSEQRKTSAFPETVQPGIPRLPKHPPTGWTRAPLKFDLYEERRPVSMRDDEEYDLVTVKRGRGGVVRRERKRGADISVKTQFTVKLGDFLISKRQIVHGACGLVPAALDGSTVSNEYAVLRSRGGIDLRFLNCLSHSIYFQQTCFHSSIGVHIEKMIFKTENWMNWDFDIPPLNEQNRIADIIEKFDSQIRIQESILRNSESQKSSLMRILFDRGNRRDITPIFTLDRLCQFYSGGTPSRSVPSYFIGDIPWIKSGELNDGEIFRTEEFISEEALNNSSTKIVPADTLLLAIYGATAGVVATTKIRAAINQAILAIIPSEKISQDFLRFYLEYQVREMKRLTQGGQPNLSGSIVKKLKIPLPSKRDQSLITEVLQCAEKQIRTERKVFELLRDERSALLQQLLSGKRRVGSVKRAAA